MNKMMKVRSISIRRDGDYGYGSTDFGKPLIAQVEVEGQHGKVQLNLSEELSKRVVEVIADELVAASRATAEAMTANVLTAVPAARQISK
jgi:hypothetical protein